MTPLIFVAGPFRGTEADMVGYKMQAMATSRVLWGMGFSVICPHTNSGHLYGLLPEPLFLEGYLEQVRRSDAVFRFLDHLPSEGATAECALAESLGKPVFRTYLDAQRWLESQKMLSAPIVETPTPL